VPDDIPSAFPADVIPIQYHFNMLSDGARMDGFDRAIQLALRPGMKVIDLGGGTGVLSWFAARQGADPAGDGGGGPGRTRGQRAR
jgi:ubiquinone/menaquinone biosynthesis C-methylase UbiE